METERKRDSNKYQRRDRASKKIRYSKHISKEIARTLAALIESLDPASDCRVCWLSYKGLADKLALKPRMVKYHIEVIEQLGVLDIKRFKKRVDALDYCAKHFDGFCLRISAKTRDQAPNLYVVNEHPFWQAPGYRLPAKLDKEMGALVAEIKKNRRQKTSAKLSSERSKTPSPPKKVVQRNAPVTSATGCTQEEKFSLANETSPSPNQTFRLPEASFADAKRCLPSGKLARGSRELTNLPTRLQFKEPQEASQLSDEEIQFLETREAHLREIGLAEGESRSELTLEPLSLQEARARGWLLAEEITAIKEANPILADEISDCVDNDGTAPTQPEETTMTEKQEQTPLLASETPPPQKPLASPEVASEQEKRLFDGPLVPPVASKTLLASPEVPPPQQPSEIPEAQGEQRRRLPGGPQAWRRKDTRTLATVSKEHRGVWSDVAATAERQKAEREKRLAKFSQFAESITN